MAATLSLKDLTPAQRKALGKRLPRAKAMPIHEVRSLAFRVMHVIADLTSTDRARVLRQATKLNEV